MQIDIEWLHSGGSQSVMKLLENADFQAYYVGGCVRNAILDMPASDIDIATDAHPKRVMELATNADIHAIPTGIEHGTVTLIIDKVPFEVTCFRKDVETDGRRAVVEFSDNIMEDAKRRDFTMNALYADYLGNISDPLHGYEDVIARRVRFIDDPDQRIAEDYLRILRFFRFHATYGDQAQGMDAESLAACAKGAHGIDGLSRERIGSEMQKLLSATDPATSVAAMMQSGVLAHILPGADAQHLNVLTHIEKDFKINWLSRLAVLGGEDHINRLRMSKTDAKSLRNIFEIIEHGIAPHRSAYLYDSNTAIAGVLALAALTEQPLSPTIFTDIELGSNAIFPIKSKDLSDDIVGKNIGDKLRFLESKWIDSKFQNTKEELLK